MAEKPSTTKKIGKLEAENKRLRLENKELQKVANYSKVHSSKGSYVVKISSILLGAFSVALLIVGSLLFWLGNTIVNTDQFVKTVTPIVQNQEVQIAVADYTTEQIYSNFDAQSYISQALPPRAEFLAPTLTSQLRSSTKNILVNVLGSTTFQEKWKTVVANAHQKFISAIQANGSDGSFDINELYQGLSNSLQSTPLSFLSDRQLPPKVGSIQILSGTWISTSYTVINNISLWRTLTIVLFFITAALSIYLSKQRRKAVIRLSTISASMLFITIISLRIIREIAASSVEPVYSEAVRQTVQILFNPLVVQLCTVIAALVLIAVISWLSGDSKNAVVVREKINKLLTGKVHQALFGNTETALSIWFRKYKQYIVSLTVVAIATTVLFIRLTPSVLLSSFLIFVLVIAITEVLAAPRKKA